MTDDTQRRGLVSDLARRLALAGHDELRVVDKLFTRLEQQRFVWTRRIATGLGDIDTRWHLATRVAPRGSVITLCDGRWPTGDAAETSDSPPVTERCMACQREAWHGRADLDPLIAAVLEQLAADDLATANLREAARAEMVGDG